MTTTVSFASSNDAWMQASDTDYDAAVNGSNATATTGSNEGFYGLARFGALYLANETFLQFAFTTPSNEVITAATLGFRHSAHTLGSPIDMVVYEHDWGGTLASGDWFNPLTVFSSEGRCFRVPYAEQSGTAQDLYSGSDELIDLLRSGSSPFRFVVCSNRQLYYGVNNPTDEYHGIWLSETALDPALVVSTVPRSTLHGVLGAQAQLSDGTWVVLESDGAATPTVTLRHVNASGTASTKATVPTGETAGHLAVQPGMGAQQLALCVDNSDNIFVAGRAGTTENSLAVKAYTKGSGYNWTAQATLTSAFPAADTQLNNFAVAWHPVGNGTLVVFGSHRSGDAHHATLTGEMAWQICSAGAALAGTGTLTRQSGSMIGQFTPHVSPYVWATPANDTGTGLDACALSTTKGVVHTWSRMSWLGDLHQTTRARYLLNSSGTGFENTVQSTPTSGSAATWGVKTGAGKLRVVPLSSDTFATISADSVSNWGLTVGVYRNSGTSTSLTLLGRVRLDNESISTMPTPATLSESAAWDAMAVTGPNKLWVYYFDKDDGRRLLRTAIDLNTYTATREEVEVSDSVGASGSTNLAIRVSRGSRTPRDTLITVANRSSGGTHSTVYVVDQPNEAPYAPTLVPRSNFDASASATFQWAFNDPDAGDTQSAYQLDINSASGVDEYDTGEVSSTTSQHVLPASTLANGQDWQWRVRTWDAAASAGAWSTYSTFSTGVGGTVTITDPVADNPTNFVYASYPVEWSLTGATQADYRVRVLRTDTEAVVYDSGWVTSSDTTHTVEDLLSDIEQRIEVTTRTGTAVESQTGTRLVTPDFESPDEPDVTVTPVPDSGHTLVTVTNPDPSGDRPTALYVQILRRPTSGLHAGDDWTVIGAVIEDGAWKDYTAASGVDYEYKARAISADGTSTDSDPVDGTLTLEGVWVHDPADPANADDNAYHFPHGWSGKNLAVDTMGGTTYFAGRQYPVVDYGEHEAEQLAVPIQIGYGDTWADDLTAIQSFARSRKTLCVRDARGRRIFGVIRYSESDQAWGTAIDVDVTRVHYDETYTTIPS